MLRSIDHIFRLGIKELRSLRADRFILGFMVYAFTLATYAVTKGASIEVSNASIAVVDEDRSMLSRDLISAFHGPYFQTPVLIETDQIDPLMNAGTFTFVVAIPPNFQADLLARRQPRVQVNVDATAVTQAGNGAAYISNILSAQVRDYLQEVEIERLRTDVVVRVLFNPNLNASWFSAVMQVINVITILGLLISGAALIREREHGTIAHLLSMPVTAHEIVLSKIWAMGLVILGAASFSLYAVVQGLLAVRIVGSVPFFLLGAALYLFSVNSLGIFLATIARSMPQFGLLSIPVFYIMILLSGSSTPLEAMPQILQTAMHVSPSVHFVAFAQAVLYRGAGLDVVWPDLLLMATIGFVFFISALLRFRQMLSESG